MVVWAGNFGIAIYALLYGSLDLIFLVELLFSLLSLLFYLSAESVSRSSSFFLCPLSVRPFTFFSLLLLVFLFLAVGSYQQPGKGEGRKFSQARHLLVSYSFFLQRGRVVGLRLVSVLSTETTFAPLDVRRTLKLCIYWVALCCCQIKCLVRQKSSERGVYYLNFDVRMKLLESKVVVH